MDRLQKGPVWLRRQVTKIPTAPAQAEAHRPGPGVRRRRHLVHDVDLATTDFHLVTGVREHEGRVWLGSLDQPAVAVHQL